MNRYIIYIILIPLIITGCALALWCKGTLNQRDKPELGETVFETGFESLEERSKWSLSPYTQWTQSGRNNTCLKVHVSEKNANLLNMIQLRLDVRKYRRCKLQFQCKVRAKGVTKPLHCHNGVKFMIHYKSRSKGLFWRNQDNIYGTFDWQKLGFTAPILDDVDEAWLYLGLQESSGTVFFDDLKVTVSGIRPIRSKPDPKAGPPFKGHALKRLRGVMSPNFFKEEDLRVLGQEWNANLIRWQMTTLWSAGYKYPQDYDLKLYDQWLDNELNELDKVLKACKKYGIMVVVDLHSPPGGRRSNNDLVMLHEPEYLDKFVSVWERIARRYRNNSVIWGFDLVNEPVHNNPLPQDIPDYLEAQLRAARAIRAIDPDRTIILEVDNWDSADGFKYLEPVKLSGIIYQVHMYYPGQFTHQGIHGNKSGVKYPGTINGYPFNKETLRNHLAPVREFQQAYNTHIYAGEFSAIRWAPDNSAYRYIRDCIDIFEEYGWDWSYHAYREWDGWSVEHGSIRSINEPSPSPTDRKRLLLEWFSKNKKPDFSKP